MNEKLYFEKQWEKAQRWPWLSSCAWQAMQDHKQNLSRWVADANGNPAHHRLLLHAISSRVTPLVHDMLTAGASANIQPYSQEHDESGIAGGSVFIPLNYAVSASESPYDPHLVDLLLGAGADPFELAPAGITLRPLMASAIDTPAAIKDLLQRGYHPDMLLNRISGMGGVENETAIQYACQGMFDKHTPRRHRRQSLQMLIEGGADLEQRQAITGKTPLLLAVMFEPILIGRLVSAGARIDARGHDGDGVIECLDIVQTYITNAKHDYPQKMKQKLTGILAQRIEAHTQVAASNARSTLRL